MAQNNIAQNSVVKVTQVNGGWDVSGDVLITTANDLLKQSQAFAIENTKIDFANVTDVDTSAVSLILEWKRRAEKENQSLTFVNLPANLISLVQLYDVADLIN
ncbi:MULTISPECIES: STAS domain-containing protein [Methylotenera]|uniref:STAS domain-containing protein n=1 Tax=Methylotenera TaxID=359407 RepID=UPI000363203F|nr:MULTISPECIES: STAS domain-containing protein [Methylotenera]